MVRKIDRTGEERLNNFGSKIIISKYNNNYDIDVYFSEYDWVAKNKRYDNFKKGNIKCPYEPRYYGKGYLGEGKYLAYINRKPTKVYNIWKDMLRRCYDDKYQEKNRLIKVVKYVLSGTIFKILLIGMRIIIIK